MSSPAQIRIGIHNEPAGSAIGGSEMSVAILAEAFAERFDVEIIHHREGLSKQSLQEFANVCLSKVAMRFVPPAHDILKTTRNPFKLHRLLGRWADELSAGYDVFISFTHGVPCRCRSAKGILMVLFPMWRLRGPNSPFDVRTAFANVLSSARATYWNWGWRKRISSYHTYLANSKYTQRWCRRRWLIDCEVIYPPISVVETASVTKSNIILSVGRFSGRGATKNQLELMQTFRRMSENGFGGWQYYSVGGLSDSAQDRAYFEQVKASAPIEGAFVIANPSRETVAQLFSQAKIFWHAMGFRVDCAARPEMAEHFGMVTAEAMAAKCVPIVFSCGGQVELVTDNVNGRLWNSLEELSSFTTAVAASEALRQEMAQGASERAKEFERKHYVAAMYNKLEEVMS